MTTTDPETSPIPAKTGGAAPTLGGGLLALGLLLTILPNLIEKATTLTSPIYGVVEMVGGISLALSCATFAFVIVRSLAHAGRRTAVR